MKNTADFRHILKRELESRMTRNPRYSLRAFAKDLAVAPPLLSDILNGKRGLSRDSAGRIALKMGLNQGERDLFCDLVESQHARSAAARKNALNRLEAKFPKNQTGRVLKFMSLDMDHFALMAEWYHFAILELLKSPNTPTDSEFIARRLGITPHQVNLAMERMEKFGLVVTVHGRKTVTSSNVKTPDGIASQAMKSHHEQFLKKAGEALFTQPLEERDFRGLTVRCKKSDVATVRERVRQFLIQLDLELSENQDGAEVYQLSTQFFRLTK